MIFTLRGIKFLFYFLHLNAVMRSVSRLYLRIPRKAKDASYTPLNTTAHDGDGSDGFLTVPLLYKPMVLFRSHSDISFVNEALSKHLLLL